MKQLGLSVMLVVSVAAVSYAQLHLPGAGKNDTSPKPKSDAAAKAPASVAPFDYYVLALAPTQFTVLALRPQATNQATNPESCGDKPLSKGAISLVRPIMPDQALIRREWELHGSCTGLTAANYFTNVLRARSLVQIPVQLTSLDGPATESPASIEGQFAGANPSFPADAFRTACSQNGLTEIRVCFDPQFKPRACPATVGECSAPEISLTPPK